jgi:hypothetical protein
MRPIVTASYICSPYREKGSCPSTTRGKTDSFQRSAVQVTRKNLPCEIKQQRETALLQSADRTKSNRIESNKSCAHLSEGQQLAVHAVLVSVEVAGHALHEGRKAPEGVHLAVHNVQDRGEQVAHALRIRGCHMSMHSVVQTLGRAGWFPAPLNSSKPKYRVNSMEKEEVDYSCRMKRCHVSVCRTWQDWGEQGAHAGWIGVCHTSINWNIPD